MKIIALNGSHRPGKTTADLIEAVLDSARQEGAETELIELTSLNIEYCTGCNGCLRQAECTIKGDDMAELGEKIIAADGLLLGSPVYWANVSARMKNFMDRSRPYHMTANLWAGRVGGAVTGAGLALGGQNPALNIMQDFMLQHSMILADSRVWDRFVASTGVGGSLFAGYNEENKPKYYRSFTDDPTVLKSAQALGRNMVKLMEATKDLRI